LRQSCFEMDICFLNIFQVFWSKEKMPMRH
jgi:hypothetical protein